MSIKVNTDPSCPGANIRQGDSLTNWNLVHQDRGKVGFSSIPKDKWDAIVWVEKESEKYGNDEGCTCGSPKKGIHARFCALVTGRRSSTEAGLAAASKK